MIYNFQYRKRAKISITYDPEIPSVLSLRGTKEYQGIIELINQGNATVMVRSVDIHSNVQGVIEFTADPIGVGDVPFELREEGGVNIVYRIEAKKLPLSIDTAITVRTSVGDFRKNFVLHCTKSRSTRRKGK